MNAAMQYELAGYQANASCIAKVVQKERPDDYDLDLVALIAAFLQRQFLLVRRLATPFAREPAEEVEREGLVRDPIDALAEAAARSLAARGVSEAAEYFLSGQEARLAGAEWHLDLAVRGLLAAGNPEETALTAGIRALLPTMRERSTWRMLAPSLPDSPLSTRYVKALSRGLSRSVLYGRSISELWPSQTGALRNGLLDADSSKVVKMPTSAGKTRVAEIAIVDQLIRDPNSRCLYIAPFRALASEVEAALDVVLADVGFSASAATGPEDTGFEERMLDGQHVLVCTPEKADLMMRVYGDTLDAVKLVVLDEGQVIGDASRGVSYDLLVTRLKRQLPDARFLLLSAVIPEETLEDFAAWLTAREDAVITSTWRPAVQRLARMDWGSRGATLRFSAGPDPDADLEQFLPGVVAPRTFQWINEHTQRINTTRFPDPANKGQLAAALALEFVETGPVLVFCAQTNWADSTAAAMLHRIELGEGAGERVPRLRHEGSQAADVAREWLGPDHLATRLLAAGIGIHHGRLPDAVRAAVEDDVRTGHLRVLVATSTLAQGVNLPVRTVIMHSVWRHDGERPERLSAREYWNIAGRAGRAGHETDGLIVHVTKSSQDRSDYEFFESHRDAVEPVLGATTALLRGLVAERISSEQAAAQLDPDLMAILVEELGESPERLEERVADTLNRTFAAAQASRRGETTAPLIEVGLQTTREIRQLAGSDDQLRAFARTGLSSASCSDIRTWLTTHADDARRAVTEAATAEELTPLVLDALAPISEMEPDAPFAGDTVDLLARWTSGLSVPEILSELGNDSASVEELARFLEDFAGYRLPWGSSAFTQLARAEFGIETVSPVASALPGIIKFGVPTPLSAWCMGLGLGHRKAAIALAQRAAWELETVTFDSLSEWLASKDPGQLSNALEIPRRPRANLFRICNKLRRPLIAGRLTEPGLLPISVSVRATSVAAIERAGQF
ncbi:MAG TPA: DEAD/DEAH box helicase, partial [Baekduia sp.]|nr:DEAD/DEAH box helicase [Baekduia sp.]